MSLCRYPYVLSICVVISIVFPCFSFHCQVWEFGFHKRLATLHMAFKVPWKTLRSEAVKHFQWNDINIESPRWNIYISTPLARLQFLELSFAMSNIQVWIVLRGFRRRCLTAAFCFVWIISLRLLSLLLTAHLLYVEMSRTLFAYLELHTHHQSS
jgi:hypothetical protein